MAENVVENQQENAVQQEVQEQPTRQRAEQPSEAPGSEPEIKKAEFESFESPPRPMDETRRIDMLMDIVLPVSIELGRTKMYIKDILELERGSIIELDKMAGEPVDLYINNKKMAEGEVVVVDKHFGIRITNLIDPADRIKNLGPTE